MNRKAESEALSSTERAPERLRGSAQARPLQPDGTEASPLGAAKPNACWIARLTTGHLDAVMRIEREAYAVPWTRGNFLDSLASGYTAACLCDAHGSVLGYSVAMPGAGELHLLNLTVAPDYQGRGHARRLLDALVVTGRQAGLTDLWLEVRASNMRARALYQRYGLFEVGTRKGYYPLKSESTPPTREDAVVMKLNLGRGA